MHAGENTGGNYDQQRGGTHTRGGSGETLLEKQKRIITERERKLKKKLEVIKKRREQVRHNRHKKHVPTVAVVGYTNAGTVIYMYVMMKYIFNTVMKWKVMHIVYLYLGCDSSKKDRQLRTHNTFIISCKETVHVNDKYRQYLQATYTHSILQLLSLIIFVFFLDPCIR